MLISEFQALHVLLYLLCCQGHQARLEYTLSVIAEKVLPQEETRTRPHPRIIYNDVVIKRGSGKKIIQAVYRMFHPCTLAWNTFHVCKWFVQLLWGITQEKGSGGLGPDRNKYRISTTKCDSMSKTRKFFNSSVTAPVMGGGGRHLFFTWDFT